jgi:hypothetical protein
MEDNMKHATNSPAFADIIDHIGDRHLLPFVDVVGNASPDDQMNVVGLDMPAPQTGRHAPERDELQTHLALHAATFATAVYFGLQGVGLSATSAQKIVCEHLTCFTLKYAHDLRRGRQNDAIEACFRETSNRMFHGVRHDNLGTAVAPYLRIVAALSRAVMEAKRFESEKRGVVSRIFSRAFGWLKPFTATLDLDRRESKLFLPDIAIVAFYTGIDCIAIWPNLKKYELLLGTASALHPWLRGEVASLRIAQYYTLNRCIAAFPEQNDSAEGMVVNYLALLAHRHLDAETFASQSYRDLYMLGLMTDPPLPQKMLIALAAQFDRRPDLSPIGLEPIG